MLMFCNIMDVEKSQRVPFYFVDVLRQEMLKNPKGSPLLARQGSALAGPGAAIRSSFCVFGYCKIIDTLKSFCYFSALDMAPTYAVPGLF